MFDLTPYERRNHHAAVFNPFRELDEMEKNFFRDSSLAEFKTDIKDAGDHFELEADLPGFRKEDIHIDLDGSYMTITAERHAEHEEKDKAGNYVRRERSYGSFTRSFDITGIQSENIEASYADGVLKLNLPKKAPEKPTAKRLEIK